MVVKQAAVLIVDDDERISWLLAEIPSDRPGWSTTTAASGTEALAYLEAKRPDLVLLDIRMPGLDGFDVYRLIRARADLATVPVLFVTALRDKQTTEQIAALPGPYRLIRKPFDLGVFDGIVDDMFGKG